MLFHVKYTAYSIESHLSVGLKNVTPNIPAFVAAPILECMTKTRLPRMVSTVINISLSHLFKISFASVTLEQIRIIGALRRLLVAL